MDAVSLALPRVCGVGPGTVTLLVATSVLALILAAVGVLATGNPLYSARSATSGWRGPLVVVAGTVVVAIVVAAVGVRGARGTWEIAGGPAPASSAATARLIVVTETVVVTVEVAAVQILRAALHRGYALRRRRAARAWRNARLVVIAGAVIVAVVVAALGIRGADGTRPLTPGRRIGGLVVIAAPIDDHAPAAPPRS